MSCRRWADSKGDAAYERRAGRGRSTTRAVHAPCELPEHAGTRRERHRHHGGIADRAPRPGAQPGTGRVGNQRLSRRIGRLHHSGRQGLRLARSAPRFRRRSRVVCVRLGDRRDGTSPRRDTGRPRAARPCRRTGGTGHAGCRQRVQFARTPCLSDQRLGGLRDARLQPRSADRREH